MKKLVYILICVAMIISISACGSTGSKVTEPETKTTEPEASTTTAEKEPVTFPLKEAVKISIMCSYNPTMPQPDNDTMDGLKKMKELTNIDIEWETVPTEGYDEAVNTRLAAGVDMPDTVAISQPNKILQLAKDKMIVPLNDILAKNCPEFIKYLDDNPLDKGQYTYPDGNIYTISGQNNPSHTTYGYLINQAALKKLGLKTPETIEEFYNMLVKFKEAGMKQPWAPIWGQEMQLASAWGVHIHPQSTGDFYAYDGKVQFEWTNSNLKDFYTWANKCYTEGLMDKEFATQSWDTLTTKIANGDVGFMDIQVGCAWSFNPIASKTESATYVACAPFEGPNGDRFIIKNYGTGAPGGFVVTKECENPEIVTAFLSWCLLSEDSFNLMYWGVEGKTYIMKDGKKTRPDGYKQDDLGKAFPQNALPYNQFFPQISEVWPNGPSDEIAITDAAVQPYFVDCYPANILTEEEMSVWSQKMADINTYVEENKQKFITGARPISEWDSYVEGLKALGIEEVLKIEQARYDRFVKAVGK